MKLKVLIPYIFILVASLTLYGSCKARRVIRKLEKSTYSLISAERTVYRKDTTPVFYTNQYNQFDISFPDIENSVEDFIRITYDTKDHYGFEYSSLLDYVIEYLNDYLEKNKQHQIESGELRFPVIHWGGQETNLSEYDHFVSLSGAGLFRLYYSFIGKDEIQFMYEISAPAGAESIKEVFRMKRVN